MSSSRYSIKPIPTRYDGYSFRSRTEARWAVFFKTLGLPYRYETEGYRVGGVNYLADFYFPDQDEKGLAACYVEIKPTEPTPEEEYKAEWLAQYTGTPVYLFHGEVRLPAEEKGAKGRLYQVRHPWLSFQAGSFDEKQRVAQPLSVSHELRVVLLHLYEAGFQIQVSHHFHLPPIFQISSRNANMMASPDQLIQWLAQLKEMQEELAGACSERIKQFLASGRGGSCANDRPVTYEQDCPLLDEAVEICKLKECMQLQILRQRMRNRLEEERPLVLLIEFDESRSPDLHSWAMCTDSECKAIGIFPGNISHDGMCGVHCKDSDVPWGGLTGRTHKNDQEYLEACAKTVSSETQELREAYLAARGESFDRKSTSK